MCIWVFFGGIDKQHTFKSQCKFFFITTILTRIDIWYYNMYTHNKLSFFCLETGKIYEDIYMYYYYVII